GASWCGDDYSGDDRGHGRQGLLVLPRRTDPFSYSLQCHNQRAEHQGRAGPLRQNRARQVRPAQPAVSRPPPRPREPNHLGSLVVGVLRLAVGPPAAAWPGVGEPRSAQAVPTSLRQARRCRFQSSSIAIGMTSLRITRSRPRWVRGRNRIASWMSGARFTKLRIWLTRARVTCPTLATSALSLSTPCRSCASSRKAKARNRASRGTRPGGSTADDSPAPGSRRL